MAAAPSIHLSRVSEKKLCLAERNYAGHTFAPRISQSQTEAIQVIYQKVKKALSEHPVMQAGGRVVVEFVQGQYNDIWYMKDQDGNVTAGGRVQDLLKPEELSALRAAKVGIESLQGVISAPLQPPKESFFGFSIPDHYKKGAPRGGLSQGAKDAIERYEAFVEGLRGKISDKQFCRLKEKHIGYAVCRAIHFSVAKTAIEKRWESLKTECNSLRDASNDAYFHDIICLSILDPHELIAYRTKHKLAVKELSLERFLVEKAIHGQPLIFEDNFLKQFLV